MEASLELFKVVVKMVKIMSSVMYFAMIIINIIFRIMHHSFSFFMHHYMFEWKDLC